MKILLLLTFTLSFLHADVAMQRAIVEVRRDIQQETMALIRERDALGTQRRDLQEELADREARVKSLRSEVERARRVQRQGIDEARRQRHELHTLRQQDADLHAMVREARRSLEAMLPSVIASRDSDAFASLDTHLRNNEPASALQDLLALYAQLHPLLGRSHLAPASALTPDGLETHGLALHIGPLSWFFATNNGEATPPSPVNNGEATPPSPVNNGEATPSSPGFLLDRPNHTLPRIYPFKNIPEMDILQGQTGELPFDLTDGRALQLGGARRPWYDRLQDGGLTMIPLVLTALASLVLVLWKTVSLWNVRGLDPKRIRSIATALRLDQMQTAREEVDIAPQPLRTLLDGALAHPRANAEELEEILHERMLALMPRLDRHLGTLAVLGGVAPLLGLLGTVTGMIHTFELVTLFGSGNERILSQGISEALVTTMSGLIIAVPVLLAHAFLSRRVRVIISELEQSIALFIQARHHGGETSTEETATAEPSGVESP